MCSRDVKGSIKLVRSDTNNYQAVAAGAEYCLIFYASHLPVAVYWCELTHFNFGVGSAPSTSCEMLFSVYK